MARTPEIRRLASKAVGGPIAQWIDGHRKSAVQLTYPQIASLLAADHDICVSAETLRVWHINADAEPDLADTA